MVRENSFSDSEGRSLTPDLSEEDDDDFVRPRSPVIATSPVGQPPLENVQPAASTARNAEVTESGLPPNGASGVPLGDGDALPALKRQNTTVNPIMTPGERFRAAVQKVIHMNRGSSAISLREIGAEPGIDPRRASAFLHYGHIKQKCTIELIDYSSVRASFAHMENRGFQEFMRDEMTSRREPWVKVRWINIGGISWDVLSSLALKYGIHPLAIEDVLHQQGSQARSKADYYLQHLFIRILRHTLGPQEKDDREREFIAPSIARLRRSSSPNMMREDGDGDYSNASGEWGENTTLACSKFSTAKLSTIRPGSQWRTPTDLEQGGKEPVRGGGRPLRLHRKRVAEMMTIEKLERSKRVNVDLIPFFIFLFRDGTVVSINQSPNIDFTAPITGRLRRRDTVLRATADPSLLVEGLLDLIVDQALEVVDEYQHKILKLERDILVKPKVKSVRFLHIMSGDLTLHKRTLAPIRTLVYGLRRYDVDRYAALADSSGSGPEEGGADSKAKAKVQGFMSHKAKIYLADVHDHIDYIISSLDMFQGISENLINYTFNMTSYQMNEVMRRLTLATIIFLPLTLLTGYFGMNFTAMWSVDKHTDLLFWEIAIPMMAVLIPIFIWPDIERMKKWATRRVENAVRSSAKKTQ